jgi:NAD(P)-dependent dehydrogenase (short-subunit alcohol dehydrogenase family)
LIDRQIEEAHVTKVIVITGAGSGLGKALTRRFTADGDHVVLIGRRTEKLQELAGQIGELASPVACDIGRPDAVRAAFARIAERHPRIDVLINHAAMIDYSPVKTASDEHIVGTVTTNLIGNILCSRAAINMMARGGHIINVSSEAVDAPYPHHVVYQATKGGIEVMSRHLQDEVRDHGIRVSVVCAGPMYGEDREMQASKPSVQAFYAACIERGIDLKKNPISEFGSVYWIFRALVDMPEDIHVDTVRFVARHP